MSAPKLGRRRTLDRNKKTQICDLVARSATMGEAAAALGVSIRTIQREARRDPDFDQQLRHAHTAAPDPLKLMQSAARSHWRAAAWLLEREDPERYGRRPAGSCSPAQFHAALGVVVEAALQATDPEQRAAVYDHVRRIADEAFQRVFPAYGAWGRNPLASPPATPLADHQRQRQLTDNRYGRHVYDYDDEQPPLAAEDPAPPHGRSQPAEPLPAVAPSPSQQPEPRRLPPTPASSVTKNNPRDTTPPRDISPTPPLPPTTSAAHPPATIRRLNPQTSNSQPFSLPHSAFHHPDSRPFARFAAKTPQFPPQRP
jgi:hypothetical protein